MHSNLAVGPMSPLIYKAGGKKIVLKKLNEFGKIFKIRLYTNYSKSNYNRNLHMEKSSELNFHPKYIINNIGSNNPKLLEPTIQLFVDAETQTDDFNYGLDKTENLNLFYCTFYQKGDVETYCNINYLKPLNIQDIASTSKMQGVLTKPLEIECFPAKFLGKPLSIQPGIYNEKKKPKNVLIDISPRVEVEPVDNLGSTRNLRLYNKFSAPVPSTFQTTRRKKKAQDLMKCSHCPEMFATFCRLQKHCKTVHNSSEFCFACDVCNVKFTRPHNLVRHKETKHRDGEKKYACDYCSRRFNRKDILTSHTYLIHSKVNLKHRKCLKKKEIHYCTFCGKYFSRTLNYNNHTSGSLSCSLCTQEFACKTGLRVHLYKQHSVTCEICRQTLPNKQQLYLHKLSHSPKFTCKFCGKRFIWESQFVVHVATHTGIKPLSCEVCGKSFAHRNAINKHKWQEHTEANKKFPCKVCGKSYVYKAKLDSHFRSHTGEKPFSCHLCSSSFSQKCNLSAHVKSVHGIYHHPVKKELQKSTPFRKKVVRKICPSSKGISAEIGSVTRKPMLKSQTRGLLQFNQDYKTETLTLVPSKSIDQANTNGPIYQIDDSPS